MVFAADYPLLNLFWTMLYIFFFVVWFWLLITAIADLFSDAEESGWAKAGWVILMIVLPFLGLFIYFIVRGRGMAERSLRRQQAAEKQFKDYVQSVATSGGGGAGSDTADQLAKLADLKAQGHISDADFEAAKAKILS